MSGLVYAYAKRALVGSPFEGLAQKARWLSQLPFRRKTSRIYGKFISSEK